MFIQKREYSKAENCFITAKKPELAIKMYTDINNYKEAVRVAKKHIPHIANEIAMQGQQQSNLSGDDIVRAAKTWEDKRDY